MQRYLAAVGVQARADRLAAERRNSADGVQARSPSPLAGHVDTAARRRTQIIERLRAAALEARQVDIADTLGVPRTTLRRIIEADRRLMLTVGPNRSRLELVET